MKVTVVGSGYVGLVTGACLADIGHQVVCFDVMQEKIDLLNAGGVPIYEPGLDAIIARCVATGNLRFTADVDEAVAFGDLQFIAVGTPPGEDGSADLTYVLNAARAIGERMKTPKVVINKSTVPVGTGQKVSQALAATLEKRGVSVAFQIISNPEFLKEGDAIDDFMRPDRIVIGSGDSADAHRARDAVMALYAPVADGGKKFVCMDVASAEFTKYAANAMLATRISFMNELAGLAETVGADIEQVRMGIGRDARIGPAFLRAGTGYGGSCFPKDVQALVRAGAANGHTLQILQQVESVNREQKTVLVRKLVSAMGGDLTGRTIALWGLAFKPNTDDMREAPSLEIIRALLQLGASVRVHDPVAMPEAKKMIEASSAIDLSRVYFSATAEEALSGADALFLVTEWKQYAEFSLQRVAALAPGMPVFDGRNVFAPEAAAAAGVTLFNIGRKQPAGAAGVMLA